MAFTRRGKVMLTIGVVVVVAVGVLVVMAAFGKGPEFIRNPLAAVTGGSPSAAATCPLTDLPPQGGSVPDRPMLAIKVENLPEARPQYGLDKADVIYEEPVEGGITRFIVMFQCNDADRVEPVRSARTSDPSFLVQYGSPLFGYADAAGYVQKAVDRAKVITDVNWKKVPKAYHHDSSRAAPHDLYTSTQELYKAGLKHDDAGAPDPVFSFSEAFPDTKARKSKEAHLEYPGGYSDVYWKYKAGHYLRYHGNVKHMVADGGQVSADNVLVQIVKTKNTGRLDPANNPVPEVISTGKGKAYLFRDGKVIFGSWSRKFEKSGVTKFTTKDGQEFQLKPGVTWVELYPSSAPKVGY